MHQIQKYLILLAALLLLPVSAKADLAPNEPQAFDGECTCEVICNGEGIRWYQVTFTTTTDVGTTDDGVASKACTAASKLKRALKSLKADITVKAAVSRFCKYGGDKAAACTVENACGEDHVICRSTSEISPGEQ